jgi:hypothetical protein
MTTSCGNLDDFIAYATTPPLQKTQLMVDRITGLIKDLDKKYDRLNAANHRIYLLDNNDKHQKAIDDTNGRYRDLQKKAFAAIAIVSVQPVPNAGHGGAEGGGRVYAKAVSGLAPNTPKLSLEDTPTEFACWISRFTSYYHASRFDVLDCKGQQGYLQACIKPDFWMMINQRRSDHTPIFEDEDDTEADSCIGFLKQEFDQRYPLIQRRYDLFVYKQDKQQSYTDYAANLVNLGAAAQLETMDETQFFIYRLITGMYDPRLQRKVLEIADSDFTLAELHRVARKYESSLSVTTAFEERVVSHTHQATQNQKPKNKNKKKSGSKSQGTLEADIVTLQGDEKIAAMQFQNLCTRCARTGHTSNDCPYAEAKCHQCGKTGHLVAACARKDKGNSTKNNNNANKSTTEDSDDTGYNRTSLVYSQADGDTPRD